jgi:hypothetical protein
LPELIQGFEKFALAVDGENFGKWAVGAAGTYNFVDEDSAARRRQWH